MFAGIRPSHWNRHRLLRLRRALLTFALFGLVSLQTACPWDDTTTTTFVQTDVPVSTKSLDVPVAFQQTPVWCWVTTGEMVFRYYSVPAVNPISYQCGIIAFAAPQCYYSCLNCVFGAPSIEFIAQMVRGYPQIAQQAAGRPVRQLNATVRYSSLSMQEVKQEIDAGRPLIAGMNPDGRYTGPFTSEHVVVISGYRSDGVNFFVTVNDPFPYDVGQLAGTGNPYLNTTGATMLQMGRYEVEYGTFLKRFQWGQTISGIG